ncbi:MAG TPA: FtsX-like permease family protein [Phycisphaerae bacterium]|nr:FtsX-like permease family protein [Phycisphaerae bacterium]
MKKIEVRDQVSLPLRRCFQLTVQGIRYRLFRSAITVVIVSLAVAFLMMMLSTSYIDREVATDARARTADRRLLTEWADKLTVPMTPQVLTEKLARLLEGGTAWKEFAGWGGLTDKQLAELKAVAVKQGQYLRYLDSLDPGERSAMVGLARGEDAIRLLNSPERIKDLADKTAIYGRFPAADPHEWLKDLVERFGATDEQRQRLLAGHAKAVASLAADLKKGDTEKTYLDLFSQTGQAGDDPVALLASHGFLLRREDLASLRTEAGLALDARTIQSLTGDQNMRSYFADEAGVQIQEVTAAHVFHNVSSARRARRMLEEIEKTRSSAQAKIDALKASLADMQVLLAKSDQEIAMIGTDRKSNPGAHSQDAARLMGLVEQDSIRRAMADRLKEKAPLIKPAQAIDVAGTVEGAAWLKDQIRVAARQLPAEIDERVDRKLPPTTLSAERIAEVASARLEQDKLSGVLSGLLVEEEGWLGFGRRTGWLILISFMVCVVGVANAMLMSVTERFREIATMKCLGALDSFIMIIFVMESSLQGVAGGAIGIVVGAVLGALRSLWSFGGLALTNLPGLILLGSAGACLVAGVILAALAAMYPAWVAARLAPMEAMRIE